MKWSRLEVCRGMAPGVVAFQRGRYRGEVVYRIHLQQAPYVMYSLSGAGHVRARRLRDLFGGSSKSRAQQLEALHDNNGYRVDRSKFTRERKRIIEHFSAYGRSYSLPVMATVWEWTQPDGTRWAVDDRRRMVFRSGLPVAGPVAVDAGMDDDQVVVEIERAVKAAQKSLGD